MLHLARFCHVEYYVLLWVLVSGVAVWTKMFYWAEADGSLNVLCKFILIIFNMIGVSSLLYELWLKWKKYLLIS